MHEGPPEQPSRGPAWRLVRQAMTVSPGWNITAALASCAVTLSVLALPALLGDAVQSVIDDAGTSWATVLPAVLVVNTVATVLASYARNRSVGDTARWLRGRLVDRILDEGLPVRERFAVGDLTARLIGSTMDVARASYDVSATSIAAIGALYITVALFLLYWPLAVVFLAALVCSFVLVRRISMAAFQGYREYQSAQALVTTRLTDALAGSRTIWANGTRDREIARVLAPLDQQGRVGRENWLTGGRAGRAVIVIAGIAEVAVLALSGAAVARGTLQPGDLVAASAYLAVGLPFFSEASGLAALPQILASAARVEEVLAPLPPAAAAGEAAGEREPGLVLRDVTVRRGGEPVLTGLSLRVRPGRTVALAGAAGSGKTTLALVVGGLLRPDTGAVLLDGVPVSPGDVAFAFERPGLVGATAGDALAYGRPATPAARIEEAARTAHASHFVEQLPRSYDTPLNEVRLSGGETQRLGIARALVQDAPVIVLDDALSSLDTVTEAEVSAALDLALSGRIRLLIARRTTVAAQADLVAWLEDGKIRALAPHQDLWADPGYRALFDTTVLTSAQETK